MTRKEREDIFNQWIEEYKPLLFKVVRVYGKNEVDDLFQEIVIQLWKSTKNFKQQCSPHTWIYRIALNTAIKWNTRSKKKNTLEIEEVKILSQKEDVDPNLEWLYTEISMMDTIDRSLTMLLLDGFSYKEMSEILGITSSHVGVKINRIKKRLQSRAELIKS